MKMRLKTRQAFSLLEIIIAVFILGFGISSLLWLQSMSQRGSFDAYYEMLAVTLAREPLEYFRGRGYLWMQRNLADLPPKFAPGSFEVPVDGAEYPIEAGLFKREIDIEAGPGYFHVVVRVLPRDAGRFSKLIGGNSEIVLQGMIFQEHGLSAGSSGNDLPPQ
jgi:hypothetical protein